MTLTKTPRATLVVLRKQVAKLNEKFSFLDRQLDDRWLDDSVKNSLRERRDHIENTVESLYQQIRVIEKSPNAKLA